MSAPDWSVAGLPVSFERRRFVVGIAAGAVGLATASLLPSAGRAAVAPGIAASGAGRLDDWSVDDVCGLYPRYSAPIGFGRPRPGAHAVEPADPQLAR